jgi:glutamate synthase (NADPH/NADH) large chain
MSFAGLQKEVMMRHERAFPPLPVARRRLEAGGLYQWKRKGERHLLQPKVIHLLQKSTRNNDYALFREYSSLIDEQGDQAISLRSMFAFQQQKSIPLEEVEPVNNILKRFATGAMSFGSLSYEAHKTLAIAMNRIGAKSNSGEGGEDEARYPRHENGDWERSAVKQVASGRFGGNELLFV